MTFGRLHYQTSISEKESLALKVSAEIWGYMRLSRRGHTKPNKTCGRYLRISIFGLLLLLIPSAGQSGQDAAVLGLLYVWPLVFDLYSFGFL